MIREEVHDIMENELRCVQRGNYCNRDCAKCPLVKEDKELIEAYGYVIKALEQEPILDQITEIIEPLRHLPIGEMSDIEWDILRVIDKYKGESEEV